MSDDLKVVKFTRRKINEWPKQVYLADFGDGDGCRPYGFIQRPDDTTPRYVRGDINDAAQARIEELEAKLAKAVEMALEECPYRWGTRPYHDWWTDRRTKLAELKGTPMSDDTKTPVSVATQDAATLAYMKGLKDDLVKREFLIFKAGRGWYRPDSRGYTLFKFDAGRYTEQEAISITHPNGEDGPRDGMYYKHESEVRDRPSDRIETLEAELAKVAAELRSLKDKAKDNGFGSSYIICHNCVDTYHSAKSLLAELEGTDQ